MIVRAQSRFARPFVMLATAALVAGATMPANAAVKDPKGSGEATAAPSSVDKGDATERRYCQTGELTGSRISKKICMTRQQWIDRNGVDPATLPHR